ncbi:MAG: hypothetical protein HYZ85_01010 [Candidatus Omnitrophica bacterium]|nr:hypothetical protein [Candidatus Omnitrophota bacterium]
MRCIFSRLIFLIFFLVSSYPVYSDEEAASVKTIEKRAKLVDLDASRLQSRFDDLERKVTQLERDNRDQDGRIRSLDRELSSLQRKL